MCVLRSLWLCVNGYKNGPPGLGTTSSSKAKTEAASRVRVVKTERSECSEVCSARGTEKA